MQEYSLMQEFKNEVLDFAPSSLHPSNLDEKWLNILLDQANSLSSSDKSTAAHELVTAVMYYIWIKNNYDEVKIKKETLNEYVEYYIVELRIEELRRKKVLDSPIPSLEEIFQDGKIHLSIKK